MQVKLYQRGGDKTNFELYKKAIEFFANELIPKTKQDNLQINIRFKQFSKKNYKFCAFVSQENSNFYNIDINKSLHFPYVISTLAHEMVHIKQGVTGKLVLGNEFIWKGKLYKNADNPNADYDDMPWEKEAYSLDTELSKKFITSIVEEIKK